MSKHFHDSLYYLSRAAHHATLGVRDFLEPHLERIRTRIGREPEPEPTRLESVREGAASFERTAEARARAAISRARGAAPTGRDPEHDDR